MAKYSDSRNTVYSIEGINAELEKVANTQDDHLSRKPGDSPNMMETVLDMNSQRILNLLDAQTDQEPATLSQVISLLGNTSTETFGYLPDNPTAEDIQGASLKHLYVVFPKDKSIFVNEIEIPATSKCRGWFLNGCNLDIKNSSLRFNNEMDFLDLQGGRIQGGLKLAKVATSSGKDQTSVTVFSGHDIEAGDWVTSSLDNNYLPNSTSRVGYGEEGDYNRVTSVVDNGDGTDTINLSYRFFRSEDSNVYTGWLENTWISGNCTFNSRGIEFLAGGNVQVRNGTIGGFAGYCLSIDDGPSSQTSVLTLKNLLIQNTFIDIVRFRGYGIVADNLHVTRQYDFSKQLFVVEQPTDGFIKIINGCRFERQNRDAEIFVTPFDSDGEADSGLIWTDGTNYFDGTQPSDLPTSDFTPPVQNENIYWGRLVAISDCLHWFVPNANGNHGGLVSNGDKFVGYIRSIYGTSFATKNVFTWNTCQFNGSQTSCSPVFNSIAGSTPKALRCTLVGGEYKNLGTNNFNQGCFTEAFNADIIVEDSAIDSPFINGAAGISALKMVGGRLEGRFRISGNLSDFKDVTLPYRGTSRAFYNPLLSGAYIGDLNSINFYLEAPRDGDFEGTGQGIKDWYDTIPTAAWFVTNVTSEAPAPPPARFQIFGINGLYEIGSETGFAHPYNVTVYAPRSDLPIFETQGKFSGIYKKGDFVYITGEKTYKELDDSQQTTSTTSGTADTTSSVTVTDAPTGTPYWVGIYDTAIEGWLYNRVASVSGSTITFTDPVVRDFPVGSDVTLVFVKP